MKVGIIGASFAKAAYLPALRHVPEAEVVALASARMESAQAAAAEFGVPHAYDDWEAMLASHSFDLVSVGAKRAHVADPLPIRVAVLRRCCFGLNVIGEHTEQTYRLRLAKLVLRILLEPISCKVAVEASALVRNFPLCCWATTKS